MFVKVAALAMVVAFAFVSAPVADAAYVDEYSSSQKIGSYGEDSSSTGDCYGKCGRGCSFYSCGYTSNCQTHDYYTRTYGLFSSQALSTFAPAIRDWGSCLYNGTKSQTKSIISKVTGYGKSLSKIVRK